MLCMPWLGKNSEPCSAACVQNLYPRHWYAVMYCVPISPSLLLRAIALGPLDNQPRHLLAHRQPGIKIAAVMDASPEPRIGGFHRKVSDEFRVTWEQIGQYLPLP